jgi:pyruvate dehydrogenase E2 component (dihydrolipoamide acetyltransferase)
MAEVIRMPKMSDTMTEGVIAVWHKKVGDTVKSGDLLAEIETDKATMDFESPEAGTLLYVGPKEKEAVAIDGILAILGKAGEDFQALLNSNDAPPASQNQNPPTEKQADTPGQPQTSEPPPAKNKDNAASKTTDFPTETKKAEKINATLIQMPKMSDTMTEGVIAVWHKKVGDTVKSGDLLAEIETDKATMDFESPEAGTLLYVGVEAGKAVAIDGVLAIIGEAGADYQALLSPQTPDSQQVKSISNGQPVPGSQPVSNGTSVKTPEPVLAGEEHRLRISPLAKVLAQEKGVDIAQLHGSGPEGRIIRKDVESFVPSTQPVQPVQPLEGKPVEKQPVTQPAPVANGEDTYEDVPLSQMRKVIARRLSESMYTAPHFYLTMEINMDKMVAAREQMNEISPSKISFNDIVIKAVAMALRKHPAVNAAWLGDKIRYNHAVHIGMAVAVSEGLLVPVLRNADRKSLSELAAEAKELGGRAKEKKLQPAEMEGGTFAVSNLGMFGIEDFTAIINPPNACILAVGGIKQVPVVKDGEIKIGNMMKVTLSCDHRVVDGATGADFLKTLKSILEEPLRLIV